MNFSVSGTATQDQDYLINTVSPVIIPAGQNSVDILITPIDDQVSGEGEEMAIFNILEGEGYEIVGADASVVISDNDEPLGLRFSALNSGDVFQEGDAVNMEVQLFGTLTDADEIQFLIKQDGGDFAKVHTESTNGSETYNYNYLANEPGTFVLKAIAQKSGVFVAEVLVDQIVVQETLKMEYKTLKEVPILVLVIK